MKKQIKIFLMLLCVLAILVAVPSCQKSNKNPDNTTTTGSDTTTTPPDSDKLVITLSETDIVIGIGETKKLSATSSLTGMETSGVLWISDNTSVATVDTSGNVKGVSDGTAIITAATIDGGSEAKCSVTVTSKVSGINIVETKITLAAGEIAELGYNIIPANASNSGVNWKSFDENVVRVSENGVITAVAPGTTSIMVWTDEGPFSDSCDVEVVIYVDSISIKQADWNVVKGLEFNIDYDIFPANATETELTWESSEEGVAIILGNGRIKAVGPGYARITVKTENGHQDSCIVTVSSPVSGVTISLKELRLNRGKDAKLTAQILPMDATIRDVTWSSSDPSVATVSQSGVVTAIKSSKDPVIITVRTTDGDYRASCQVWVSNPLTSIVFDKTTLNLSIFDDPVTLIPTYDPIDADDIADVRWASTNPKVATVDENGVVTPVGDGIAEITLSTNYGVYASCMVTVVTTLKPVESITVETGYVVLKPGMIHVPVVTVLPEDAGDKSYTLSSSNSDIVKVNEDGSLTAISKGMVTITVTSVLTPEVSKDFYVKVEEMTQEEIDSALTKYNDALANENTRYLDAIAKIDSRYAYLIDLKKDLDSYDAQKAEIEKNLTDYGTLLAEAVIANNQELITQYTDLIKQEQDKLTKLENDFVNYPAMLQMYTEKNAEYEAEVAKEKQLNADNVAKINSEYAYILPYLPAT